MCSLPEPYTRRIQKVTSPVFSELARDPSLGSSGALARCTRALAAWTHVASPASTGNCFGGLADL